MSLKSYLQSLIDVLLKKSVENVSPNSELHSQVMVNSGETLVSPVDGFVNLVSQSATGDNNFLVAVSNASSHQHSTFQNLICRLDLPVKKGASIQVEHQNIGLVTASFITRVGGGDS